MLLQSLFPEQQTLWLGGNWLGQLPKRLLRQTKYYFGHFTAEALDFVDGPNSGRLDFDVCSDAGVTQHAAKTVEMASIAARP